MFLFFAHCGGAKTRLPGNTGVGSSSPERRFLAFQGCFKVGGDLKSYIVALAYVPRSSR